MTAQSNLMVERRDDNVHVITLNRPEKHNALDSGLTEALLNALLDAEADTSCRAIVLTGSGASFCAGADTSEFAGLSEDPVHAMQRADMTTRLHAVFSEIGTPVVAAVRGNALGGGAGIALACDLMIVADDIRFGYPELRHGIVPAVVMANLVGQIGRKGAFALVATGKTIDGSEAEKLGIAYSVLPASEVVDHAIELASKMAKWSPVAMSTTKRLLHRVAELSLADGLRAGRDTNIIMRGFRKGSTAS